MELYDWSMTQVRVFIIVFSTPARESMQLARKKWFVWTTHWLNDVLAELFVFSSSHDACEAACCSSQVWYAGIAHWIFLTAFRYRRGRKMKVFCPKGERHCIESIWCVVLVVQVSSLLEIRGKGDLLFYKIFFKNQCNYQKTSDICLKPNKIFRFPLESDIGLNYKLSSCIYQSTRHFSMSTNHL